MADTDEYIDAHAAGAILGLSPRQAMRYGAGPNAPVWTRLEGRRFVFHAGDVRALAEQRRAHTLAPRPPRPTLVPAGAILDYLRERDAQLADAQAQLAQVLLELGRLQGEHQRLREIQTQYQGLEAERDAPRIPLVATQAKRDTLKRVLERQLNQQ